jgi:low temperature requirement protein LtrA
MPVPRLTVEATNRMYIVTDSAHGTGLLREHTEDHQQVTFIELFFDLVFVFAVTQLSNLLLHHLTLLGAAQTCVLLLAAWRAWMDTAWVTNWFDPDRAPVRLMLVGVMMVSLIMSAALPQAFSHRGLVFAAAFVALQVGRTTFVILALEGQSPLRRNFQRILARIIVSGVLWLAGGFVSGSGRDVLWVAAIVIDFAAPATGFFTPGLGRSTIADWTIAGAHLAERCQLFLIIALGESILVSGVTFGGLPWTAPRVAACIVAFFGTVALWWIYFYRSAQGGRDVIAAATDPGRLGRSAYTYFHLPMVAGIIVTAVANELTIAHPEGHARQALVAVIVGGPILFVAGHALFKWTLSGRVYISRVVTIIVLGAVVPCSLAFPTLALAITVSLILVALASWETWTVRQTTRREHERVSEPTPPVAPLQVPR